MGKMQIIRPYQIHRDSSLPLTGRAKELQEKLKKVHDSYRERLVITENLSEEDLFEIWKRYPNGFE